MDRDKSSRKHKRDETSEERRARKAAKKTSSIASPAINLSFADSLDAIDYSTQFVWNKKKEKDKALGIDEVAAQQRELARKQEARDELDKLNKRRAEREHETRLRESEAARNAVENESRQMAEWIAKEDDFYLEQAKKRAEIRVRERRAQPIDFLALNLKWSVPRESMQMQDDDEGEGLDVDLEEPYNIFVNINLEETEQLEQDIKMYLSLEKNPYNQEFWRSMLLVCVSALEDRRSERNLTAANQHNQQALKADFAKMLKGKQQDQLTALQGSVQRKLTSGEPIDVEYWESLLKELIVWKAKAKLKEMHEIVLQNRLEQLRRKQRDEAHQMQAELANAIPLPVEESVPEAEIDKDESATVPTLPEPEIAEEWDSAMEPRPLPFLTDEDRQLELLDPLKDLEALYAARRAVHSTRFVSRKQRANNNDDGDYRSKDAVAEALYQAEVEKGFDEDEELFNMEQELTKQSYSWEDKYRPRKPRYFNKVLTGFEWNKYNQTHYDADNPPPKVVTGYRMVLFYPDLIDKTKAPSFKVVKNKENPDIATLIFSAGPPYEDIAFSILSLDWEMSHKRGYRCSFDRGVLSLAFTFKRLHYRK